MKKLFALLTVLCAVTAFSGCAGENVRDESTSGAAVSGSSTAERDPQLTYYDSIDGMFSFGMSGDLTTEDQDTSNFRFTDANGNDRIEIMTLCGSHQNVVGFCTAMIPDYEEEFLSASGEELTVCGLPAYRISCDAEGGAVFENTSVQFGNGDIFMVNVSEDAEDHTYRDMAEDIIRSVEYKGAPLKTESEVYENEHYSIELPPQWAYVEQENDRTKICVNLANDLDEFALACRIIVLDDVSDIREYADEKADGYKEKAKDGKVITEQVDLFGENASRVSFVSNNSDSGIVFDQYYLNKNGVDYTFSMTYCDATKDRYEKELLPLIETISFK